MKRFIFCITALVLSQGAKSEETLNSSEVGIQMKGAVIRAVIPIPGSDYPIFITARTGKLQIQKSLLHFDEVGGKLDLMFKTDKNGQTTQLVYAHSLRLF